MTISTITERGPAGAFAPALGRTGENIARTSKPLLSLKSVARRFMTSRQNTTALEGLTFDVHAGEFLCIVGPSGGGKSTLLNVIAGLDAPDGGQVLFEDKPVTKASPERVVVFQEPALFPWLNVRANVEFGLLLKGSPAEERRAAVDRCLDMVNLRHFERAYVHELSGGMKQRVQLARALAVEPRMLLMDEPFAALDAQTRDILQHELQEIWARTRTTIIFVTHNVREAVILADRVLVMTPSPGRVKAAIPVPLPRPRDADAHEVVDLAARVRAELQHDVVSV
ncbi:MAG: ABC transporter ATP-binding protein [Dehalococcoidia bacterium]|nr:ABC transporter ATP-binding protein [Dehalococcoidia bacterium]